ncbi:FadR/GntR family transcriptional regulator [Bradyrhizobium genosp. P]|uniref:FadR/GntR family transcriptional regulator n=1 Tax=Bradyrhizobium genosp. P TaxID=83641 RepID=UPI003CE91E2A
MLAELQGGAERSYHRVALDIMQLIEDGEVNVGERLPSERALADRFEISRTSVREAIIALEIRGIVEVRGGSGIYVCGTEPADFLLHDATPSPFELLGARLLIEPEIAAVSAVRAKDTDLNKISAALRELRQTMRDKQANEAADRRFHVAIAEGTGNSVLVQMVTSVWDKVRGAMWLKLEEHFHTPALRQATMEDHQRIFAVLAARNPEESRAAMRMHIERVMREFAQNWS